ncbi:hypothetical protein ACJRO7_024211 [Eucalyptus globulus]|uniref:N-acetyltransferase domain-containing protein n=1 Tax=Eucalyptus globulus TaxID=34317 RepID=A0ABD3KDH4_EUCGL
MIGMRVLLMLLALYNPFLSHGFLLSLEESNSAVKETGWMPRHIVAKDESGTVVGVVPLYLKSHSYGEFVFDHSWADAYYSYGSRYYPKYQCCVPFTPVTSPRILLRDSLYKDQVFDIVVDALKYLVAKSQVSSVHITFSSENERQNLKEKGFLQRIGMQYHWTNRNYTCFDDFLMDMKQNKRKNICQERKKAKHWDSFYTFYRNTTDNMWGSPYLTREFFHNMGSKMGDQVLLVVAEEGDELVVGALNLIGGDTIYGRLGAVTRKLIIPAYILKLVITSPSYANEKFPIKEFTVELQKQRKEEVAIEAAIELNLKTVEAGAQGEHKIQRGYMPVPTYSCHYLLDEEFSKAIEEFVVREATQMITVDAQRLPSYFRYLFDRTSFRNAL